MKEVYRRNSVFKEKQLLKKAIYDLLSQKIHKHFFLQDILPVGMIRVDYNDIVIIELLWFLNRSNESDEGKS